MLGLCLHRHAARSTMSATDFAKHQRHCMICREHPKVSQILTLFPDKLPRLGYELWFKNPETYDLAMQGICCCFPQRCRSLRSGICHLCTQRHIFVACLNFVCKHRSRTLLFVPISRLCFRNEGPRHHLLLFTGIASQFSLVSSA